MTIALLQEVLLWCTIINLGLFTLSFVILTLAHDLVHRYHGKWYKLSVETFDAAARMAADLFAAGTAWAESRGLILVDTKYEIGVDAKGELVVADEIHTPDSSRYWYADTYEQAMRQGRDPQALDKEYVRRWLVEQGYRGEGVPPSLPDDVRCEAARRYIEAYERITGTDFVPDVAPPEQRIAAALGL